MIAGLKWPPEMWPRFDTMIPIARPFASATATMSWPLTMPAPPPMKIKRERADELGDAATEHVLVHRGGIVGLTSDGTGIGTLDVMSSEAKPHAGFEVECPHCHKTFTAEVIEGVGGALPRLQVPALPAVRPRRARRRATRCRAIPTLS